MHHIRGKGGGVFGRKVLGVLCIRSSGRYSLGSATNVTRAVTALNMAASRDPKTSVFGYGSNGIKQLQARVKVSSTAELRCGVVVVAAAQPLLTPSSHNHCPAPERLSCLRPGSRPRLESPLLPGYRGVVRRRQ